MTNPIPEATGQKPARPAYPLPTTPIERLITAAMDDWPAGKKWTFNFFRSRYGGEAVTVGDTIAGSVRQRVSFAEYLTYCEFPFATSLVNVPSSSPLYLFLCQPFSKYPELLEDFAPPYFEDNCYRSLAGQLREWLVVFRAARHRDSAACGPPDDARVACANSRAQTLPSVLT
jgi:hypothetical protein